MRNRALICVTLGIALAACGGRESPGDEQVLTGHERFGWDQPARSRSDLAAFRYALYVDGKRAEAVDVSCGNVPSAAGFPCSCRLPPMAPGPHTLQVAAFLTEDGNVTESSRSAPVKVVVK